MLNWKNGYSKNHSNRCELYPNKKTYVCYLKQKKLQGHKTEWISVEKIDVCIYF